VVRLRDDVRSGELSLAVFAADLHDVVLGKARRIYRDPAEFFALTYPTFNLRELAKEVALRLARRSDKAVRQLELTYGGGKTHALITLYHLVTDPESLPDLPAADEFRQHAGIPLPRARVAVLPFDKLDVEKGMEVRAPGGQSRWLKHPWSALAFQLAGPDGLATIHPDGRDEERQSPPAEPLLADLLERPQREDLATLVLIDEVLMFARVKVGLDPAWRGYLETFFQCLTQAATKVDRCAVVASLLATDPRRSDRLGKDLTRGFYAIFRRERERGVEPVVKADVAEVLRRRFFTPDSIKDREAFRPHVVAALKGLADLDDQTRREGKAVEDRLLSSYPFHPDLTDVLYEKWTNLEGFQRTRGVLRTFAMALREAEGWDTSPLVGPAAFLAEPECAEVSDAARELTSIAATEEYEGKRQEWAAILSGELGRAAAIQDEYPGLSGRELEQAVVATFLHSQPVGQKAATRDLTLLVGATRPDRIELDKALRQWAQESWFLDDRLAETVTPEGEPKLPTAWRLGSRPNLKQMHHEALGRVTAVAIDEVLLNRLGKLKHLTEGASAAGAAVHKLPASPRYVDDDGTFRYVVLGPRAASEVGKPSAQARRFVEETTAPDRPRVNRNAILLAVPSREGLEAARARIRDHLAWQDVRSQLEGQEIDPTREATLAANLGSSGGEIGTALKEAWCLAATVSKDNAIEAFKVRPGDENLFSRIKGDKRSRIHEAAVNAEALLPEGPYDLWKEGETARRVRDLVGAFAQLPHLPKMLHRQAVLDTLVAGCREGLFVLRLPRPDGTARTWWRVEPDEGTLTDPVLEVALPESAVLSEPDPSQLAPHHLPGLWPEEGGIASKDLHDYFSGGHVVSIPREGYEEPLAVPRAERAAVDAAVTAAVEQGLLWLVRGPASICGEPIPAGVLTEDARLQGPPEPVPATRLLPEALPAAWKDGKTTALGVSSALSAETDDILPWPAVRQAIRGALAARLLELAPDSGPWPCDVTGAGAVKLRPPEAPPPRKTHLVAEAELETHQVQDLADATGILAEVAAGHELRYKLRLELALDPQPDEQTREELDRILGEIHQDLKLE